MPRAFLLLPRPFPGRPCRGGPAHLNQPCTIGLHIVILHDICTVRRSLPNWPTFSRAPGNCLLNYRPANMTPCVSPLPISPGIPASQGGKPIERCVISTFKIAESMGFQGDLRHWEDLLRISEGLSSNQRVVKFYNYNSAD